MLFLKGHDAGVDDVARCNIGQGLCGLAAALRRAHRCCTVQQLGRDRRVARCNTPQAAVPNLGWVRCRCTVQHKGRALCGSSYSLTLSPLTLHGAIPILHVRALHGATLGQGEETFHEGHDTGVEYVARCNTGVGRGEDPAAPRAGLDDVARCITTVTLLKRCTVQSGTGRRKKTREGGRSHRRLRVLLGLRNR